VPVALQADGRERLKYVEGDVPLPTYPAWAQTDDALGSIAELMRAFHDASFHFDFAGLEWSDELADPVGGPVVCHNDVCLENVVFRDGAAVGLIDFDFAAPGRPTYDLAQFACMCVPVDDDLSASRLGWEPSHRPRRLRLVADTYGLVGEQRLKLFQILTETIDRGGQFVRRRVAAGDPNFIRMWNEMGGAERFDRRLRWWTEQRSIFMGALA
jgi:aminoglycoside phosphotransferase (APT) family kinase protein